jgi:hypothetical protein
MPKSSKKNLKHKIGGDPTSEAVNPEAPKPEAPKPEAVKPEAVKPEAPKPEAEAVKPAEAASVNTQTAAETKTAEKSLFSLLNFSSLFGKKTGGRRNKKTASKNKKMMGGKSRKTKK